MALVTMDFRSSELMMNTLVYVVLPDPNQGGVYVPLSQRKVLWLLHGLSDDGSAWVRHSRIEHYAEEKGIVVVMPSAGRSMYCDNVLGQNYFTHIARELPDYLSLVFGLSKKREDNFVAGLSMGGMGAMKLALTYPERYAAAGSFSGVLDLRVLLHALNDATKNEFPFIVSELPKIETTPLSPVNLLDAHKHKDLRLYVSCGLQDDLLAASYSFRDRVNALSLNAKFVFEDGMHEWEFWNRQIRAFLDFITE